MKITLKNYEIENIVACVRSQDCVFAKPTTRFSMTFAYAFMNNMKNINALFDVYNQLRQDLMNGYMDDKYSYTDENGARKVRDEFIVEYNNKMTELVAQENEVEIKKIPLEKMSPEGMDGFDKIGISIPELETISFMIEEPMDTVEE